MRVGDTLLSCEDVEEAAARVAQLYLTGCRSIEYVHGLSDEEHERLIELATDHVTAVAVV